MSGLMHIKNVGHLMKCHIYVINLQHFRFFGILFLIATWLSTLAAHQAHARQTLYLPFDGAYANDTATAKRVTEHLGVEHYRSGRFGKALQVGGIYGNLKLSTGASFSAKEGTLSMWVSPVDWEATDDDFHVFFDARGSGALVLYKYFEGARTQFLATRDIEQSNLNVLVGQRVDWKPGTWVHLAASWSFQGIRLYVNGVPVAKLPTQAELPTSLSESFQLGDLSWGRPRTSSSLMDEVRIFDNALTPSQVRALADGKSGSAIYTKPGADALVISHESTNRSGVTISTEWSADVEKTPITINVVLLCGDGSEASRQTITVNTTLHRLTLPVPRCAVGSRLKVRVETTAQSGTSFTKALALDAVDEALLANGELRSAPLSPILFDSTGASAGPLQSTASALPEKIPAPWHSPRVEGNQVEVWGRQFRFAKGALASSIYSQQQLILSAGIQVRYGGQPLELTSVGSIKRSGTHSGDIKIESEYRTSDGLRFRVYGRLFYDGVYHISVKALSQVRLAKDLEISIPVAGAILQRWHRFNGKALENTGAFAAGDGLLLNDSFTPYLWVGNERVGLTWYAESDRYWPSASREDAIKITRTADTSAINLFIAPAHELLKKNWQFDFGLLPTPVRPTVASKGSRWRFAPLSQPEIEVLWPDSSERSFRYYGYPEARDPAIFAAEIERRQKAGIRVAPYLTPTFVSTLAPEWRSAGQQWSMKRFDSTSVDVMASGGALAMVSPRAATWQTFFTSRLDTFLTDYQPAAIYLDNSQLYGASAPDAGVGYRVGDKIRPEYPLLAYRDLFGRIGIVADRHNGPLRILHVSGQLNPMIAAQGHYYLNGEQYRGVVDDSYLDTVGLPEFRQQFSSHWSGAAPIFIPGFSEENAALTQPTHEMLGMLFLHDVSLWPVLCNLKVVQQGIDALTRAVPAKTRFVRYDDPALPVSVSPSQMLVSAHVGSTDSVLVAMNTGNKIEAQICLNADLDSGANVIEDRLTGKTFKRSSAGCYRVPFPARGYRLLQQ